MLTACRIALLWAAGIAVTLSGGVDRPGKRENR